MRPLFVVLTLCAALACDRSPAPYAWAFSAEMDGRVHVRERCRETLAEIVTRPDAPIRREDVPGVFTYLSGEPYRIHAFRDQESCEHARALVVRHTAASATLYHARGSSTAQQRIATFEGDRSENALRCEAVAGFLERTEPSLLRYWCEEGAAAP